MPVDPIAPPKRNGYILADCDVSVIVVENRFKGTLYSASFPIAARTPKCW